MVKKTGLGRGFDSLIPTDVLDESFDPTASQEAKASDLRHVKLDEIVPNSEQPRRSFDEETLQELTASIKEHGVVQPIVVTPHMGGYQIVAGERRWRAAQAAGLTRIPAIVRTLSSQHKLEIALIENLQRKDLNPLETATAYLKLHTQFNMTYEAIGQRVGGKAVSTISNALRLLQLPESAKTALVAGEISEGHARQVLALDDKKAQEELVRRIIAESWSVRKAEQFVVGFKKGSASEEKTEKAVKHTQTETVFTKHLSERLGVPVSHKTTAKGGQLIIKYRSDEELAALEQKLG
ncbi:ParB/RepB/Spo0J family partition protein [Candidatus Saccharibacteria bacterium]|nr:MAG: ParB/RepB/Spo0J family partition protein [Candidatus Saccharibacteria bacterium]